MTLNNSLYHNYNTALFILAHYGMFVKKLSCKLMKSGLLNLFVLNDKSGDCVKM